MMPQVARKFEQRMWTWFNEMYNFIQQVEDSHGALLELLDARNAAIIEDDTLAEREISKAERQFKREYKKWRRDAFADIRVGAPDDGLMEARGVAPGASAALGAQSPSR